MAHVMADMSQAPPVWVSATVHEIADGGISSGASHFDIRYDKPFIKLHHICVTRTFRLCIYPQLFVIQYNNS